MFSFFLKSTGILQISIPLFSFFFFSKSTSCQTGTWLLSVIPDTLQISTPLFSFFSKSTAWPLSDGHLVAVYDTRHPSDQHPIVLFRFKEYCMSDGHLVAVCDTRHPSDQRLLPLFEYWRPCSEHFIRISIKKEKKACMHARTRARTHARKLARTHARTHAHMHSRTYAHTLLLSSNTDVLQMWISSLVPPMTIGVF